MTLTCQKQANLPEYLSRVTWPSWLLCFPFVSTLWDVIVASFQVLTCPLSFKSSRLIPRYIPSVDYIVKPGYRDKSDGIMDNLGLVFRFPRGKGGEIFSAPKGPQRLLGQTSRLLNVNTGIFLLELSRGVIKLAPDIQPNPAVSGALSPCPHMPPWRAYRRILF
jgi:hypothetical protein